MPDPRRCYSSSSFLSIANTRAGQEADVLQQLLGYLMPPAEQTSSAESPAGFQIIIAIVIGVILTSIIWAWLGPKLKRNHERLEERLQGADKATKAAIDFYRPPPSIRYGKAGVVLQFILILLPITLLVYYVLSKI